MASLSFFFIHIEIPHRISLNKATECTQRDTVVFCALQLVHLKSNDLTLMGGFYTFFFDNPLKGELPINRSALLGQCSVVELGEEKAFSQSCC